MPATRFVQNETRRSWNWYTDDELDRLACKLLILAYFDELLEEDGRSPCGWNHRHDAAERPARPQMQARDVSPAAPHGKWSLSVSNKIRDLVAPPATKLLY